MDNQNKNWKMFFFDGTSKEKSSWIVHINKLTSFEVYGSADIFNNKQYTRGLYYL